MSEIWSSQCAINLSSWKSNLKKIQAWTGFEPMTLQRGAMLYPLSYQATWIDGQLWVRDIPDDSGLYEYEHMKIIYVNCGHIHIHIIHIYIHIIHYHQVYHQLTIDHLSMWLGSSVDRALHRYRKVMGLNPIQAWIFFRLLFQLLKLIAHCEDQISLMFHPQFTYMIFIHVYSYSYCTLRVSRESQEDNMWSE